MNISREEYQNIIKEKRNYKAMTLDFIESFIFGGLVCLLGQVILNILSKKMPVEDAKSYLIMLYIAIASFLTGLGLFDKLEEKLKMALAIPITGFSNSLTSSMLDFKREGLVCGIGTNTFRLAGSVLLYGTIAGIAVGVLRYLIEG